jgi:hypothetical protein
MSYSQLIQLYFERSTALQNYWTLYVVVIGGLLAISNLRTRRDRLTVILVTVLYCSFAYKNLSAIEDTTLQRNAVLSSIQQYHGSDAPTGEANFRQSIEPTLVGPTVESIKHFHAGCDVLVVLMLWAMERRRAIMAREARHST